MKYVSEMTFVHVIVGLFKSCAFDKHVFTYTSPHLCVCVCFHSLMCVFEVDSSTQGLHIDEALLDQFGCCLASLHRAVRVMGI